MELIPKTRLKSNLENSRSEFEQCTPIEKVWCTPHWGTDIWILYSRPTDTLHRNIEIHHPPVFNTHFKALSIAFNYLGLRCSDILVFINVFVLKCFWALGQCGVLKAWVGRRKVKEAGSFQLNCEIGRWGVGCTWGGWALEMNLELHFLILHTLKVFSFYKKKDSKSNIFSWNRIQILQAPNTNIAHVVIW